MASVQQQTIYEQILSGKRVVATTARALPALRVWLWRNGFSYKKNCHGDVVNLMITEK